MKHYQKNLLIPLLMAIVMMAMSPMKMWADGVSYLKPTYKTAGDPKTGVASWSTATAENPTLVTSSDEAVTWGAAGQESWYYVSGNVTLTKGAVCKGNVHLILCDNAKLTVTNSNYNSAGIHVSGDDNSFTIYAQSTGASMGALSATGTDVEEGGGGGGGAGIGGDGGVGGTRNEHDIIPSCMGQNITINGGKISATAGGQAACIGGGVAGGINGLYINGGIVTASHPYYLNAIGKGPGQSNNDYNLKDVYVNTDLIILVGNEPNPTTPSLFTNTGGDLAKTIFGYAYIFIHQHNYVNDVCPGCGASRVPAGDGSAASPYQIANADNLLWFMEKEATNTNMPTEYYAKLTADIVINENVLNVDGTLNGTPSVVWIEPKYFAGCLDGDGHTISGIYIPDNYSTNYNKAMVDTNNGTIKNLGILDSYIGNGNFNASFATSNTTGGNITDCYSYATVGTASNYSGGIVAYNQQYVTNCYFAGKMMTNTSVSSPIIGKHDSSDKTKYKNNYYLSTTLLSDMNTAVGTSVSAEDFASGRLAMLLQAGRTTAVWGQNIDKSTPYDAHPVINGPAVYANKFNCNGTVASDAQLSNTEYASVTTAEHVQNSDPTHHAATCTKGSYDTYTCTVCGTAYNSAEADDKVAHTPDADSHTEAHAATCSAEGWYEYWNCSVCGGYFSDAQCTNQYDDDYKNDTNNGVWIAKLPHTTSADYDENGLKICSVCHEFDCEAPTLVNDESSAFNNYYAIKNAGNMLWFNQKVETVPNINGYLVNNVDLSSVCHAANAETGVSKLNWDPIGSRNSYLGTFDGNSKAITGLYVNGESRNGLFASIGNGSKVKNLTVEGEVTGPNAAVIVSMSFDNVEISNCTSKGKVNGTSGKTAGVLGSDNSGGQATVTYCTNRATITSASSYTGGVVGNDPRKVEHCVNHGDVTGCGGNTGGVVGYMNLITYPISDCANHGSVTDNGSYSNVGGVAGHSQGVTRCSNDGNVTATSASNVGGISGYTAGGYSYGFKDCMNKGDIKGCNDVGGLSGYLNAANNADSYSIGKVECSSPNAGLLIGYYYNIPTTALSNVYYVKGATVKANGAEIANQFIGSGDISTPAKAVESADVASGKLAMLLRGDSETSTWGQDLANTNKAYPVLGGPKVYFSGSYKCNGVVLTTAYTNDASQEATIPAHSSEYDNNGFCTTCGESKTLHGTGTAEDPYLISSVAQLEQFSTMSNANSSAYYGGCAKLVNDIDLLLSSNATWTPICATSYGYTGTFDGNGHTVKNMVVSLNNTYSGFIAQANVNNGAYAVIKNLTVEGDISGYVTNMGMIIGFSYGTDIINCTAKGSVKNSSTGSAYTGGVTGYNTYCGTVRTFEGCVNYADVSSANCNVGGILGYMYQPVIISKCTNYGNISSSNTSTGNVGGILGYGCANGGFTMSDCANYGDVSTQASNVAGLVGYVYPNSSNIIKDCYVGPCSVRGNSNTYVTTFEPSGSYSTFSNIVYSKDCKVYSSYSATEPATLSSYVACSSYNTSAAFVGVSAAQIASGEATYLLNGSANGGTTWTQDLSKADGQPTLLGDADQYGVYLMGYAHGATARSFSNDASKKNSLHPAAEDGSHDNYLVFTSNGNQTHEALCSVCGHEEHNEACNMVENVCNKCLYELLSSLELADGTEYTRTSAATATSLTYKRIFANTTYNALYVPFQMSYSDWSEKADVYRLLNIFEEDEDDNGTIDKWVLKIVKLKAGESIKANTPYIIKAKATGDMEIILQNVTLAAAQEKSYWCASLDNKFVFTGTYAQKAIAADSYFFMSTEGGLQYAASAVTLNPQRWYMGIYNKDTDALVAPSTFNTTSSPSKGIIISCDDEDATGIDEVSGFKSQVSGKFIENGKVVIIRNGKKYNLNGQVIK